MHRFRLAALCAAMLFGFSTPALAAKPRLSLTDALARAQGSDPSVPAADARSEAADATIRQSGMGPNPSLGLEVENFGGTGERRGFSDVETTLSYQQDIELGGKRDARIKLATRQREAASARALIMRLNLFEAVQRAYMQALASEAEIALAQERLKIARELEAELGRRIASARDPEFAGARATTEVADAALALDQARLGADAARAQLASFLGGDAGFTLDGASFEAITVPAVKPDALSADLQLLEAERSSAAASEDLERSNAVRDPTFNLGIRHYSGNDDVAVVVGGSIPLNLFDDNSGAIDRAAAERRAADLDAASYRLARDREIQRLTTQLTIAAAEIRQIDTAIIPAASRAVRQVRDGFSNGAFSYLDVIAAQTALIDTRARRINALRRFHEDKASLDRLLGVHAALAEGAVQ